MIWMGFHVVLCLLLVCWLGRLDPTQGWIGYVASVCVSLVAGGDIIQNGYEYIWGMIGSR